MKLIKTISLIAIIGLCACATSTPKVDQMPGGEAIAFDFDGTCAVTPDLCVAFFQATLEKGLIPVILTARSKTADAMTGGQVAKFAAKASEQLGATIPVIFAGGKMKSKAALDAGFSPLAICDDRSVTKTIQAIAKTEKLNLIYICGPTVPAPSPLERIQQILSKSTNRHDFTSFNLFS